MSKAPYARRAESREGAKVNLLIGTHEALRQEAEARAVPFATLAAALLDVIAREKMFDAVLDGEMPRVKEGA